MNESKVWRHDSNRWIAEAQLWIRSINTCEYMKFKYRALKQLNLHVSIQIFTLKFIVRNTIITCKLNLPTSKDHSCYDISLHKIIFSSHSDNMALNYLICMCRLIIYFKHNCFLISHGMTKHTTWNV